jgi:multiple sugar transport system permease protein
MKRGLLYLLMGLIFIYCLFPFVWTFLTAMKAEEEVFRLPVQYLPEQISVENLRNVFYKRPFAQYIVNSLIVAGGATLLTLWIASLTAFRLRSMELEKAMKIQRWFLIGAILPPALLPIPIFMVMRKLGLVNHYFGLIFPYVALNLPSMRRHGSMVFPP